MIYLGTTYGERYYSDRGFPALVRPLEPGARSSLSRRYVYKHLFKIHIIRRYCQMSNMVLVPMTSSAVGLEILLLILAHLVDPISAGAGNEWDYEGDIGPQQWHKNYPQCAGKRQSPVSIDTTLVVYDEALKGLQLDGYNSVSAVNMSLTNNGHTVQVDLNGKSLTVQGGGLPGVYKAAQFHFHWGAVDKRGSEHNLDNQNFPMEMHIVHYQNQYTSIKEAMVHDEGLMVLGFFFKVGRHNRHFDDVLGHFSDITHKDDHVNIPTIPLRQLMANNLDLYYRYQGSLTTPPCYESVIWTVFREPIEVSEYQLEQFRNRVKKNYPGEPDLDLTDDFRPVQPLNHRIVYGSHLDTTLPYQSEGENGAGQIMIPLYIIVLSVCISLLL